MALNSHKTEEDRISWLYDDILLSILSKVNLRTAMRASVLSTRWRHLPWLLTQLSLDIQDFFREPCADPPLDDHIHKAMSSLTEAVGRMLASTHRQSVIAKLCISLFLTSSYSSEIGYLLNGAIENGMVKDIELTSGIERLPFDVSDEEMTNHADSISSFFVNYPNISYSLRSLILFNATFAESDLHNLFEKTCTQLCYLYLYQCDTGVNKIFKIDAPNSKLSVLEFAHCSSDRVDVVCLPKLTQLILGFWCTPFLPLTLGYVPCLKEVEITAPTASYQDEPFKLSELLCDTTCINILTLDFRAQKIWVQPENQLRSAFSNLRELSLLGIFTGFGVLWLGAFLEAAPSLEILNIEVCNHICEEMGEDLEVFGERTNGRWDTFELAHSSKPLPLKKLQFCGFNSTEEHIIFIGAVMKRASNLKDVVLKEYYCEDCSAISSPVPSSECSFPMSEDEKEIVMNKFRNRFSSCAQIMFSHSKSSD